MRSAALVALGILVLAAGCRTSKERDPNDPVYAALGDEDRALVDAGRIRVGMTPEQVRLSWGKPSDVVESESEAGREEIWVYRDAYLSSRPVWVSPGWRRPMRRPLPYYPGDFVYDSVEYIRAEVAFSGGVVNRWRTFPAPEG